MGFELQSVAGFFAMPFAAFGVTTAVFALSVHPRIKSQKGWTTSALVIALCFAAVGILFNILAASIGDAKKAARSALKAIQFIFYVIAFVLVLVMLSSGADRPATDQTAAFWYAAYADVFFGVAWFLALIDLVAAKSPAAAAESHDGAAAPSGEDVQIVPVGGKQNSSTESSGWRFVWWFLLVVPPIFGLVVFTAIRYRGHNYAIDLHYAIVFAAGIGGAIWMLFLGILYYWKAFNSNAAYPGDLYAIGALLAAFIGGVLSTENDLSLTVICLYAIYGMTAVVLLRLAVTPATKHLLFLR